MADSPPWPEHLIGRLIFCGRCGTSLFYRLKDADDHVLCTGSFDDQTVFRVAGEIYIDEKPAGYDLAGDHLRLTGEQFQSSLRGD